MSRAQSEEALAELCQRYWKPVYLYMRSRGFGRHDAEDLTQGFFRSLLERGSFARVSESKGKLRTFLLVAAKRHVVDHRRHQSALKRGGHKDVIPFESLVELRPQAREIERPDSLYDRNWTLALLDRVLSILKGEYEARGKAGLFDALKEALVWDQGDLPYSDLATEFDSTEGALRIAVYRLRQRYRELLHREVADTLNDPCNVDDEVLHLVSTMG